MPQELHRSRVNAAPRSEFVDMTAWGFIGLGVFGALLGAGQLVYLAVLIPIGQITQVMHDMAHTLPWPEWARILVRHLPQWLLSMTAISLLTIWTAVGLMRRREWARKAFVIMMWAGVVANLAGAVLPFRADFSPASLVTILPPEWRSFFGSMLASSQASFAWTAALSAVLFAGLFAWTGVVLQSENVRREFDAS